MNHLPLGRCRPAKLTERRCGAHSWLEVIVRPEPPLSTVVDRLWFLEGDPLLLTARIPPAAGVDIVVSLGHPLSITRSGRGPVTLERSWVEGLRDGFIDSTACGETRLVGARLHPEGAAALLRGAVAGIRNEFVPTDDVWGRDARTLVDELTDGATVHDCLTTLAARLERWVDPDAVDTRVAVAARVLRRGDLRPSITRLSRHLALSRQRFAGRFHSQIGTTPKRFARSARFDRVLRSIADARPPDWASVAVEHGFSDQAHLVREFRAMLGCTPTEFVRGRDNMEQNVIILAEELRATALPRAAP